MLLFLLVWFILFMLVLLRDSFKGFVCIMNLKIVFMGGFKLCFEGFFEIEVIDGVMINDVL